MKHLVFFLATLILSTGARADEITIRAADYDAAEAAPTYFKFVGHSKKLGLIGTSFSGFAKAATVTYQKQAKALSGITLKIEVAGLDTDNKSRNEKMWDTCLDREKFPEIVVRLQGAVDPERERQEIPAEMAVRGKTVPLMLVLEKKGEGDFVGTSSFKLTEAGIPDPSILVASVKDEFEIEFRIGAGDLK